MNSWGRHAAAVLLVTTACAAEAPPPADTVVAAPAAAPAGETIDPWRAFWESEDGTRVAVDTTRQATTTDGAMVWVRTTFPDSAGPGDPLPRETRLVDTQQHIDCAGQTLAPGHIIARDAAGTVLVELPTPAELQFTPPMPDTQQSALVTLVCYTIGAGRSSTR